MKWHFRQYAPGEKTRDPIQGEFFATEAIRNPAYLFPGLHPDGYEDKDSGWPRVLKRFAAEAWRRADAGELADDELYACYAQWSGLFDRMLVHLPEETERRVELAAAYGE